MPSTPNSIVYRKKCSIPLFPIQIFSCHMETEFMVYYWLQTDSLVTFESVNTQARFKVQVVCFKGLINYSLFIPFPLNHYMLMPSAFQVVERKWKET